MNLPPGPLLQLAIDSADIAVARRLVQDVYPHFDILEVGTPLVLAEGLRAIETLRKGFPTSYSLPTERLWTPATAMQPCRVPTFSSWVEVSPQVHHRKKPVPNTPTRYTR